MDRDETAGHVKDRDVLDLRMLGPLQAWRGGQRLALGGRRQRSVLACLLLDPDRDVSTDRIVDAVWGGHPPSSVLTTLQAYIFHLREALEPSRAKGAAPSVIVTIPGGYHLETTTVTVDARRFEDLVTAGRAMPTSDPATATLLNQALELWRGDVLSDLASLDGFAAPAVARLEETRVEATELWIECELALGHAGAPSVLSAIDDLVARYPMREHLAALRMLALYRAGRQSDALAAYRRLRQTLDDELGVQPSAELVKLHQQVLRQDLRLDLTTPSAPDDPTAQRALGPPLQPPGQVETTRSARDISTLATRQHGRRRSRRKLSYWINRRRWAAVTAIALTVAALIAWMVPSRRGEITPLPANSVGPVGAAGLEGVAVSLGSAPSALVSAGGAIWAVEGAADAVVRIDPQDRRVTQTVRGVGGAPQAAAALGGDLWVVASDDKVVTRLDQETAQLGHRIPVGIDPIAVVAGPSGVWVANSGDNTVTHIDPVTEHADEPIFVGDGPDALGLDGSTLWVANGRSGTISQIDTRTKERLAADIRVDAGPAALAVTTTDVWVANEGGQSVSRIERSTGRVQRIHVDDGPSSIVMVDDEAWVTNRYSGTISRIDIRTNALTTIDVASAASALVEVDGQIWAAAGALGNAEHRGGTLAWTGLPLAPTVDPAYAYFPLNATLLRSVYDGLAAFRMGAGRSSLGLVPDLATDLPEPSDGGRTYVFTIRPDIRYSTGALVQASDFVRGLRRALQPTAANPALLRAIVGAANCLGLKSPRGDCDLTGGVVADDAAGRLTLHLTEPDPELLEKLSLLLYPVPPGTPTGDQGWAPVPGAGPYTVATAGPQSVTLTRNPYFSQWSAAAQPDGFPDVITYRPVESQAEAVADVLNGTAAGTFTDEPLPLSATSRPAFIHPFELLDLQMVYPNFTVPPFDDKRVRQALNLAVDRNAAGALGGPKGEHASATCQLIPPGIPGHRPYCPYHKGAADGPYQGPDLEKARALVAESGTLGIPIVMYYGPYDVLKPRAEYAAGVLRDLGYQVTVEPAQPDAPRSVTDKYQIQARLGWVPDYPLPGTYYDGSVDCEATTLTHYCNLTVQGLADQARSLRRTDPATSLALWSRVDHLLTDDAALVPLTNRVGTVVVRPEVGNVMTRAGFGPLLDQMWMT